MKNASEHETLESSNLISLCDNIVSQIEIGNKRNGKCSKALSLLRHNFSIARRLYIKSVEFEQKNSELSDSLSWLCDNYAMIEEEYLSCASSLRKEKTIIEKKGLPLLFSAFSKLLEFCDGKIENRHIVAIITACDKYLASGFGVCDFLSVPNVMKSSVLCHIGKSCDLIMKNAGFTDNDDSARQLINSIKSLRFLSVYDFNEAFSKCKLEVLLSQDPSGAYQRMTTDSKSELLHKISLSARRKRKTDCEYAKELLATAEKAQNENEKYIGYSIENNSLLSKLYFPILYVSSVLCTLLLCFATDILLFPVLYFPVFESVKILVDTIFSKLCKDARNLPTIDIRDIPEDAKTLCVITALLSGSENDSALFDRIEKIRNANSSNNIRFGLLCDLPDSDRATNANDSSIIQNAVERVESLNLKYNKAFILLIRDRSYSKSEKKFMAYERKRGAVIDLIKMIKGEKHGFDISFPGICENSGFIEDVKYVITLDADTNLGLEAAHHLVGKMIHPANKAVIDKKHHCITKGYGILQPRMSTDLQSSRATPFTRLLCGAGGTDIYSDAAFDIYHSIFGDGIFCGKGIIDVNAFYESIIKADVFPEDRILSHDILEGERARTALLCDTELTDGFPKNELSFIKRKHRWIRGDIQNLIFLKKYKKTSDNTRVKVFSFLSRYKIFDNARRALTPIFSFLLIPLSLLFSQEKSTIMFFVSFSPYILPFIIETLNVAKTLTLKSTARRFFSRGVTISLWQSFLRMLFFGCMLAKDAFLSLSATVLSLYRMIVSKRNLLEWVTAAHSENKKNGILLFVLKHLLSCLAGALIFVFAPGGLIKFSGLAFLVMPLIGYFTSKDSIPKKLTSEKNKRIMRAYASDIWKFFKENVTSSDNNLPPDNIQLSPYEKIAHRTSPTNVGLYLTSILAALDFGFIDSKEAVDRIEKTINTVEELPKWHGHLYNWYDTKNLSVLEPKYISSVDSGNFIACLITLLRGLAEYTGEQPTILDLITRINRIVTETDFEILYNEKRNLFSVGITVYDNYAKKDEGCYDYLMSEARILSYVACAFRKVPALHWKKLSRPIVSDGGYIGISSWSGTAFEFFMPCLFMPAGKNSMLYESMLFSYRAQSKRKISGVWGISESGYFAFDSELNYQYKAFGVPMLSQKVTSDHDLVISPYSSFLSMCVGADGALSNLASLEKLKAYGKYGFFEALDFSPSRIKSGNALIKSYMSHHLGMSLLALGNACFDDIFVQRFMSDPKMQSASELLEEKIPVNVRIKKLKRTKLPVIHRDKKDVENEITIKDPAPLFPVCTCVSDGKMSLVVSDTGHIDAKKGDCNLIKSVYNKYPDNASESIMTYISLDGRIYGMTPICNATCADSKYSFSYTEYSANHNLSCDGGNFTVGYTISSDSGSVLRIKLSGKTQAKKAEVRFAFTPCLANERTYASHPAFSELFIESAYDENDKILYYIRRKRSEIEEDAVLAVAFCNKNSLPVFSTRKNFCEYDKYSYFSDITDNVCGACINPFCIFGTEFDSKVNTELLIAMTHSKQSAAEAISKSRSTSFEDAKAELFDTSSQFTLNAGISSLSPDGAVRKMLTGICFSDTDQKDNLSVFSNKTVFSNRSETLSKNSLWKYGISGDEKIALIDTGGYFFKERLEKQIRAYKLLAMKNKRFDLVILYNETDGYERSLEKRIRKLISDCNADVFLERKKCGIIFVEKEKASCDIAAIVHGASYIEDITKTKNVTIEKKKAANILHPITRGKPTSKKFDGFKVQGGTFAKDAFIIDKYSAASPAAPYAHVLSGENFSCVLTQDSLGYTFCKNASECRVTPFSSGGNKQCEGENLYLFEKDKLFDLIKCAQIVKYSCGKAEYFGMVAETKYHITIICAEKLSAKAIKISFNGAVSENAKVFYCVDPCMGDVSSRCSFFVKDNSTVVFKNPLSRTLSDYTGHLSVFSKNKKYALCDKASFFTNGKTKLAHCEFACVGADISKNEQLLFVLGASKNKKCLENIEREFSQYSDKLFDGAERFAKTLIPKITFTGKCHNIRCESISQMFNLYLPYDTAFSRMLARSGFYQSGGAYGFRDQLQDVLCIIYADKKRALNHIYRAATHQFLEGDVLHWWHEQTLSGVRTKCSDDYLWLVYACVEYYKISGSNEFLKTRLPYISSPALAEKEVERYGVFSKSDVWESLYNHNLRALDRALSLRGKHGLCLMGSCDWCDGYSLVGKNMQGESTFTTMFLIMLLKLFIPICIEFGDDELSEKYQKSINDLENSVKTHCYDKENGYFLRGFYDDGEKLCSNESDEGKIDLMAQSFAALSDIDDEMSIGALIKAHELLFDKEYGIMKLLSPPFDKTKKEPGYIKGYLPGVRENGGQYTHGAMFYALACFEMAEKKYVQDKVLSKMLAEYATNVILWSNPAFRSSFATRDDVRCAYKTEPYSVAADIYSNVDHKGRGGWTHYTGACGWMYRLILRYLFGIEFKATECDSPQLVLHLDRIFPMKDDINEGELKINEFGFDVEIKYIADGQKFVLADNKKSKSNIFGNNTRKIEAHI
ncbi:MAG: hypothetical protein E7656_05010 [Ruminococcaceae bacterium]|nr:hypothetical protein [Oscillospiraceae bacterium]